MARINHQNVTDCDEHEFLIKPLKRKLDVFWFLVPFLSVFSVASVLVSISTQGWLNTLERMPNPAYNGSGDMEFLFKRTVSGLFSYCYTNPGDDNFHCKRIDYFAQDYSPDIQDSTLVIPYVVSKVAIFFLLASCTMTAAFVCSVLGQCVRYRGVYTFVSGLLFVLTGLLMLLGLIVYIALFKAEVGSKLRSVSAIRPPLFEYTYGYSFFLYIVGLIATNFAGLGCIFLFMYRVQYHWKRKYFDELRKGNRAPSITNLPRIVDPPLPVEYPCRRHPYYYVNSNSTLTFPRSPARNRIPLPPKDTSATVRESPCSLHRMRFHQSTPSLKDVATSFYDFPPPPTISYQFDEHFSNRDRAMSRDVTLNTVSTTADVNLDDLPEPYFDEYSPSLPHEFVTFDLDEPLPVRAQSIVSINSRSGNNGGGGARKNFECDNMRRTTPV
ncbi:voltage-dependent calcium channel gamma-4 subunit [Anthonomus grandis grandis]|uniref:voltage-dependent calcium channel gamma-4 subunit n=1 Tax=Anthonomus grandis grandis TaxID=2921223 RepID=UPI002166BD9E|nr:voltage-dependent calcium channel gamma-4 subunit [Anthonomus grandis grandis]